MSGLEHALACLPKALQEGVAIYWQDYTSTAKQIGVIPPHDSAILEQLCRIWACSDFVARSCVRDPGMLTELLASGDLWCSYTPDECAIRLVRALAEVENETQLGIFLRRFRRREMVRIAWRDCLGFAVLEETLAELSRLAEALLADTLQRLYEWQTQRLGVPRNSVGQAQQLVVLGMGKLGGGELNYSSDVDLIFTYPQSGETDARRPLSNEEFFRRLGQRFIKILSEPTAEGFVCRVDMRLRPFGDSGSLVMPFTAVKEYYQNHGREWERYAMIKARVVAGDQRAGNQLLAEMRPFIYRRYLDYGAFEALRTMKALIAKEVVRKGLQRNIKLGPGGIREIEFIAQVFQLIYGGREPALQARSALKVLSYLADSRRLPRNAVAGLKQAYAFLRCVENRLQAYADQQTHNLPEEPVAKLRLAYAMGFFDWQAFSAVLKEHVRTVSAQFELIFAAPQTETEQDGTALDFVLLWRGVTDEENAMQFLAEHGFEDPARVCSALQAFKNSYSYRSMSQRGRERMHTLMPLLLGAVAGTTNTTVTLERILRLLETIARRSVYLTLLVENPLALSQLVKLCAASAWISKYLTRYPLLLDDLLDPDTLYHPPDRSRLGGELDSYLTRVPKQDTEQVMDALRHFKQTNVLRIAAADVSDAMPVMIVSDYLTEIAEVLLRKVLALARDDLIPRYGQPCCSEDGKRREAQFAIIAYGKLGGIELNYGSDLDLVFLHDSRGERQQTNGPRELDNPTFFARLVQRIIHWLTAHTPAGELYEVDTRLRPSGRAGLLVSSIDAFAEYQRSQAWTWEHQALVRTRVVAGPAELAKQFSDIRHEVLARKRDLLHLRREVREMRERMRQELGSHEPGYFDLKQDRGGIADIEFMVQYAVLANAHRYPALLIYTDNIRQLDGLEKFRILTTEEATRLRDAYRSLRHRLHQLTLQEQSGMIPETELSDDRQTVLGLWRQVMEAD